MDWPVRFVDITFDTLVDPTRRKGTMFHSRDTELPDDGDDDLWGCC